MNPKVDLIFKKLFGSEEHQVILKSFINAVLSSDQQMETIELKNPYSFARYKEAEEFIIHVSASDQRGQQYAIEIQLATQVSYAKRALYHWAKGYLDQPGSRCIYDALHKTISIHLVDFRYLDEPDYHNVYRLLNAKSHNEHSTALEVHFIELCKFDSQEQKIHAALDHWVAFLNEGHKYSPTCIPADSGVAQAIAELTLMSLTEDEQKTYKMQFNAFEKRFEQLRVAREEGKREMALKIAQNLIGLIDVELIAQKTGLSVDEVEGLKEA